MAKLAIKYFLEHSFYFQTIFCDLLDQKVIYPGKGVHLHKDRQKNRYYFHNQLVNFNI